jgi:hypothetical protein
MKGPKLHLSPEDRRRRREYLSRFNEDSAGNLTLKSASVTMLERSRILSLEKAGRRYNVPGNIVTHAIALGMHVPDLEAWHRTYRTR